MPLRLLLNAKKGLKLAKQHNKTYFSPQKNCNIKSICYKTAYVQIKIFTPVLINFTQALLALLATFRKSEPHLLFWLCFLCLGSAALSCVSSFTAVLSIVVAGGTSANPLLSAAGGEAGGFVASTELIFAGA